jgi:hypothetical protein
MKYKLFFVIIICALLFFGNYTYQSLKARIDFNNHIKNAEKNCPYAYYVNRMSWPTTVLPRNFVQESFQDYVTDVHGKVTHHLRKDYLNEKGLSIFKEGGYFVDIVTDESGRNKNSAGQNTTESKTKDLFDKDLEWVFNNCNIKPSYVY